MDDSKTRILVVDDDRLMREVLTAILRSDGFDVVGEARDGHAALTQVGKLSPEVVCLDVNMPGLSGLEVLKSIQSASPETVVVMITGDATMATVRDAVGNGAAGYIIKPFRAGHVGRAIRAAMKGAEDSPFG